MSKFYLLKFMLYFQEMHTDIKVAMFFIERFFMFRFMSPLSVVPLVTLTGFGLYEFGFPLVCTFCFVLG